MDSLCKNHDLEVLNWKEKLECVLKTGMREQNELLQPPSKQKDVIEGKTKINYLHACNSILAVYIYNRYVLSTNKSS